FRSADNLDVQRRVEAIVLDPDPPPGAVRVHEVFEIIQARGGKFDGRALGQIQWQENVGVLQMGMVGQWQGGLTHHIDNKGEGFAVRFTRIADVTEDRLEGGTLIEKWQ